MQRAEEEYLDDALAEFSGYLAADELYDGPFCVLSAAQGDLLWFLARLHDQLGARRQAVLGITTDGSPLYPQPIALVFGDIPHQVCEFHVLKELTKTVLHALADLRKRLAAQAPKCPCGRPRNTAAAKRKHHRAQRIKQRVAELFEHRHLFVRHQLTASQRCTLKGLMRGESRLKALRAIMDEVYRLFDRRCRTDTALAKLAKLRRRVRRHGSLEKLLDRLDSPNLEKALTFLDGRRGQPPTPEDATDGVSRATPGNATGPDGSGSATGPASTWPPGDNLDPSPSSRRDIESRFLCYSLTFSLISCCFFSTGPLHSPQHALAIRFSTFLFTSDDHSFEGRRRFVVDGKQPRNRYSPSTAAIR